MGNNYTNNPPTYKGEMQNGKKHGKGVYLFPNGERYEGEWANDQINGQGTFYFSDGSNHHLQLYYFVIENLDELLYMKIL